MEQPTSLQLSLTTVAAKKPPFTFEKYQFIANFFTASIHSAPIKAANHICFISSHSCISPNGVVVVVGGALHAKRVKIAESITIIIIGQRLVLRSSH